MREGNLKFEKEFYIDGQFACIEKKQKYKTLIEKIQDELESKELCELIKQIKIKHNTVEDSLNNSLRELTYESSSAQKLARDRDADVIKKNYYVILQNCNFSNLPLILMADFYFQAAEHFWAQHLYIDAFPYYTQSCYHLRNLNDCINHNGYQAEGVNLLKNLVNYRLKLMVLWKSVTSLQSVLLQQLPVSMLAKEDKTYFYKQLSFYKNQLRNYIFFLVNDEYAHQVLIKDDILEFIEKLKKEEGELENHHKELLAICGQGLSQSGHNKNEALSGFDFIATLQQRRKEAVIDFKKSREVWSLRQAHYSHNTRELLGDVAKHAFTLLGNSPCNFCLLVGGSLARDEMQLDSDIDCALLIQQIDYSDHPYFINYIRLFEFLVKCLSDPWGLSWHESTLIEESLGLRLDQGNIKNIRSIGEGVFSFINEPNKLATSVLQASSSKDGQDNVYGFELLYTLPLFANNEKGEELWVNYQQALIMGMHISDVAKAEPLIHYCDLATNFFAKDSLSIRESLFKKPLSDCKIKEDFIKPVALLLSYLGLYFKFTSDMDQVADTDINPNLTSSNLFKSDKKQPETLLANVTVILQKLKNRNKFSVNFINVLQQMWDYLLWLRYELNQDEEKKIPEQLLQQFREMILQPLYQCIENRVQTKTLQILSQNDNPFLEFLLNELRETGTKWYLKRLQWCSEIWQKDREEGVLQFDFSPLLQPYFIANYCMLVIAMHLFPFANIAEKKQQTFDDLFNDVNVIKWNKFSYPLQLKFFLILKDFTKHCSELEIAIPEIVSLGLLVLVKALSKVENFVAVQGIYRSIRFSLQKNSILLAYFEKCLKADVRLEDTYAALWHSLWESLLVKNENAAAETIVQVKRIRQSDALQLSDAGRIINLKTGEFKRATGVCYQISQNRVNYLSKIHFKKDPKYPGREYAARSFWTWLTSEESYPLELLRLEVLQQGKQLANHLVLATQTIAGEPLENYTQHPGKIAGLDKHHLFWSIIYSLLMMFEDAKANNHKLLTTNEGKKRIESFDQDQNLVEAVVEAELINKIQDKRAIKEVQKLKVQAKDIKYCLDEIMDEIEPESMEAFLEKFTPEYCHFILEAWLHDLQENYQDCYPVSPILFSTSDNKANFYDNLLNEKTEKAALVDLYFRDFTVVKLENKLLAIYRLFKHHQEKRTRPTYFEIIETTEPVLASVYSYAHQHHATPDARFKFIENGQYEVIKIIEATENKLEHSPASYLRSNLRTKVQLQAMYDEIPKELNDFEKKKNRLPKHLLAELEEVKKQTQQCEQVILKLKNGDKESYLQFLQTQFSQLKCDVLREMTLEDIHLDRLAENEQQQIIEALIDAGKKIEAVITIKKISLENCTSLTDQQLQSLLSYLPQLIELNISGCEKLTNLNGLRNCQQLRKLVANRLLNVIELDSLFYTARFPQLLYVEMKECRLISVNIQAPLLRTFDISDNFSLQQVSLQSPYLRKLTVKECLKITKLKTGSTQLDEINLTNCANISESQLTTLASQAINLTKLCLEGCNLIKHREFRQKYPFLLTLSFNEEDKDLIFELENILNEFKKEYINQLPDRTCNEVILAVISSWLKLLFYKEKIVDNLFNDLKREVDNGFFGHYLTQESGQGLVQIFPVLSESQRYKAAHRLVAMRINFMKKENEYHECIDLIRVQVQLSRFFFEVEVFEGEEYRPFAIKDLQLSFIIMREGTAKKRIQLLIVLPENQRHLMIKKHLGGLIREKTIEDILQLAAVVSEVERQEIVAVLLNTPIYKSYLKPLVKGALEKISAMSREMSLKQAVARRGKSEEEGLDLQREVISESRLQDIENVIKSLLLKKSFSKLAGYINFKSLQVWLRNAFTRATLLNSTVNPPANLIKKHQGFFNSTEASRAAETISGNNLINSEEQKPMDPNEKNYLELMGHK